MLREFEFSINGTRHYVRGEVISTTLLDYLQAIGKKPPGGSGTGDDFVGLGAFDGDGNVVVRVVDASRVYLPQLAGMDVLTIEAIADELDDVESLLDVLLDDRPSRQRGLLMNAFEAAGRREVLTPGAMALQSSNGEDASLAWDGILALQRWTSEMKKIGKQPADLLRIGDVAAKPSFSYEDATGRRFYRCASIEEVFRLRQEYPRAQLISRGFLSGLESTNIESGRGVGYVISLDAVAELGGILDLDESFEVGAACPISSVCEALAVEFPDFASAVGRSFPRADLHRLSLGGLLASRDRAGVTGGALLVEDADLLLHSREGEREVSVREFFAEESVLRDDELIGAVRMKKADGGEAEVFRGHEEIRRGRSGTGSVMDMICRIGLGADREIESARIALASHGRRPQYLEDVCAEMVGKEWGVELAKEVTQRIREDADCRDTSVATGKYRQAMAGALWQKIFYENPEPGVRRSLQPEMAEMWNGGAG
ncbi:MAG: FAD binding domain-containing protein [Verrucomicrobiota bacterium]